jgi:hypothetical protein
MLCDVLWPPAIISLVIGHFFMCGIVECGILNSGAVDCCCSPSSLSVATIQYGTTQKPKATLGNQTNQLDILK